MRPCLLVVNINILISLLIIHFNKTKGHDTIKYTRIIVLTCLAMLLKLDRGLADSTTLQILNMHPFGEF